MNDLGGRACGWLPRGRKLVELVLGPPADVRLNTLEPCAARQAAPSELSSAGLSRGQKLTQLVFDSQSWVHRRVDILHLGAEGDTRRSVSLDITVPQDLAIAGSKDRMIVPLALMRREPLRGFESTDTSGHMISVLSADDNRDLALEMLQAMVPEKALRSEGLRRECEAKVRKIVVEAVPEKAQEFEQEFSNWMRMTVESDPSLSEAEKADLGLFEQFAKRFVRHFLFAVELDQGLAGTRTVLRYSYDVDSPEINGGGRSTGFTYEVPDFGFAAIQHLEVQVPHGITVECVELSELPGPKSRMTKRSVDVPDRERTAGHVSLAPSSRADRADLTFWAAPARAGLQRVTCWALTLVSVTFAAAMVLKYDLFNLPILKEEAKIPSDAASILLIGPALLFSWLSRAPEHELAARLLNPLRNILLLCAAVLFLMAVAAAVPLRQPFWDLLWWAVFVFWLWALVLFVRFQGWPEKSRRGRPGGNTDGNDVSKPPGH